MPLNKQPTNLAARKARPRGGLPSDTASSAAGLPGPRRPIVLLRRPQVLSKLGICRSALHQWLDPESPYHLPDMPRPIKLSARSRNCYWIEEELDAFIRQRVAQAQEVAPGGGR